MIFYFKVILLSMFSALRGGKKSIYTERQAAFHEMFSPSCMAMTISWGKRLYVGAMTSHPFLTSRMDFSTH